jgi:hypothetical protein
MRWIFLLKAHKIKSVLFVWPPNSQQTVQNTENRNSYTFLDPNCTPFALCHFRAQKSLDFQGPLLPMALKMDFQNHYIPRHINDRYINSKHGPSDVSDQTFDIWTNTYHVRSPICAVLFMYTQQHFLLLIFILYDLVFIFILTQHCTPSLTPPISQRQIVFCIYSYIYPEVLVGARPERKEVLLLTLYSVRAVVKERVSKDLRWTS